MARQGIEGRWSKSKVDRATSNPLCDNIARKNANQLRVYHHERGYIDNGFEYNTPQ